MANEIKIESGIPLPKRVKRLKMPNLPFSSMEVGQSIKLDVKGNDMDRTLNSLRMKVQRYQRVHPAFHFSVIKEDEKTVRIFRVPAKHKESYTRRQDY